MWRVLEDDGDLGHPRPQPLSGAQIERRPVPAPVGDLRLDRHEALSARSGVLRILAIARLAIDTAILAAHHVAKPVQWFQAAQHLKLLVAHRIRLKMRRRLHGDEAEQLQKMVLHHVPNRAVPVIIGAPAADTDPLGDGDLHMVDMARVPDRFEQRIGKAQRHQVLHRLLPEIVVDPVDLALFEQRRELAVQRLRALEIAAQRLLDDQARVRRPAATRRQPFADRAE